MQSNALLGFRSMGSLLEILSSYHEIIFLAVWKSCNQRKFKNPVGEYSGISTGNTYVSKAVTIILVYRGMSPVDTKTTLTPPHDKIMTNEKLCYNVLNFYAIDRHLGSFQVLFVFTISNDRLMNTFTHRHVKVSPGLI